MDKQIVFVIGSGRSGTHLIGRIIGSHPEFDAYLEHERTFGLVTKIATQQVSRKKIDKLISEYSKLFAKSKYEHIVEKSHPNIWLVEELVAAFPQARFVGIYRDVYSTVASMLKHEGVSAWFDILPQNKTNPFLGINEVNRNDYDSFTIEQKSTLRWKSHYDRLQQLKYSFPNNVLVVDYNELLINQDKYLKELSLFLDIDNSFEPETFNIESLSKWKLQLSNEQIDFIDSVA